VSTVWLIFRRITLGGFFGSMLSLILKGNMILGNPIVIAGFAIAYIMFAFFSWLSIVISAKKLGLEPVNFFGTVFRCLRMDIISPIGAIVDCAKKKYSKKERVLILIFTYIVLLTNIIIVLVA